MINGKYSGAPVSSVRVDIGAVRVGIGARWILEHAQVRHVRELVHTEVIDRDRGEK